MNSPVRGTIVSHFFGRRKMLKWPIGGILAHPNGHFEILDFAQPREKRAKRKVAQEASSWPFGGHRCDRPKKCESPGEDDG
jgi:hypothetical protein